MRSSSVPPLASNRQTSTFVALAENNEKLTPWPSHVAPRGNGSPSRTRFLRMLAMLKSPIPGGSVADQRPPAGLVAAITRPGGRVAVAHDVPRRGAGDMADMAQSREAPQSVTAGQFAAGLQRVKLCTAPY